jgi:hypothetical protein
VSGYEWLPDPTPKIVTCEHCGAEHEEMPERPYFGPETRQAYEMRMMWVRAYSGRSLDGLFPGGIELERVVKT